MPDSLDVKLSAPVINSKGTKTAYTQLGGYVIRVDRENDIAYVLWVSQGKYSWVKVDDIHVE